ncbi:MAG: nicotinate (nicotinamide) nucleotide adenylyltransferase [Angelakisella sp.]|jgi:nicotinate-nucleotide adenylyltransferase|nr:nicotinate (nicotinamide) nucleotide adenylyltransferase [Angelakisella sp.]
MSQTVLYGGTFNPIHRGHLDICVRARQAVDARRVLLMPAAQPPHKSAGWLAPDQDRLAMCALAAREYDLIQVDDWEIRRGGRSYTVDTLGHLAAVFPEEELWLLIGTDMFLTFTQWHRWEEIGKMASLLVASREEGDRERLLDQQQKLAEQGVRSRLLQNPPMPMSSTQIREELRRDGTTGKVCPQVLDYIREKELYLHPPEELDYLRRYIRPLMTDYRYRHSLGVEKQAVKMARRFGADQRKAALAGILHDVCKDMPKGALLQNILESGIINGIDFKASPQLIHSYAGALYLQSHMDIHDTEVIEAVRYHTTARAGMSLLETVVYLADLTSEDREYPDVGEMRRLCDTDLRKAMIHALTHTVKELTRKQKPICPDTLGACKEYGVTIPTMNGGVL